MESRITTAAIACKVLWVFLQPGMDEFFRELSAGRRRQGDLHGLFS